MKFCILIAYEFLTKNLNFRVSQCISGHVISQNVEFIRLAISQQILIIETSGLDKKFHKIMRRTFPFFGVVKCISGHLTGQLQRFFL